MTNPVDFRARQVQVNKIIANDPDGPTNKILIYGNTANTDNHGGVNSGVFPQSASIALDTFLYVSGAVNSKTDSKAGIAVFGGDVVVSGALYQGLNNDTKGGNYSHVEGSGNVASGEGSHAEGQGTTAGGQYSHAEGQGAQTTVAGIYAHAEGYYSIAAAYAAHAEGQGTVAGSNGSHAEGWNTYIFDNSVPGQDGYYAHVEGEGCSACGDSSHAEGLNSAASGSYSHAEGERTIAKAYGSHAEGFYTIANSNGSHVEGDHTYTFSLNIDSQHGYFAHAEGRETSACGDSSHAEGWQTHASGTYSHAEGYGTITLGTSSHAEGENTATVLYGFQCDLIAASSPHDIAFVDIASPKGDPSSAFPVGSFVYIQTNITTKPSIYKISSVGSYGAGIPGILQIGISSSYDNQGHPTTPDSGCNIFPLYSTSPFASQDIFLIGNHGHSEGLESYSSQDGSHAEGYKSKTIGDYSHTEGYQAYTIGSYSHAEGRETIAFGDHSHAEGRKTRAVGNYSHAEGTGSVAYGQHSHAEGLSTIAYKANQNAVGQYNIDRNNTSLFVIGNGTDNSTRADIFRAESTGELVLSGGIRHAAKIWTPAVDNDIYPMQKSDYFLVVDTYANNTHRNAIVTLPSVNSSTDVGLTVKIRSGESTSGTATVTINPANGELIDCLGEQTSLILNSPSSPFTVFGHPGMCVTLIYMGLITSILPAQNRWYLTDYSAC